MIAIFSFAFNAIAPILLLILLGYYLKNKHVFSEQFFKTVNRFTFHYTFPALMFCNIYSLEGIHEIDLHLAAYLLVSTVTITLIGVVIAQFATNQRNRKGVLIQAGFRSNFSVIGLPLAEGLAGTQGSILAASMQAPTVIYYNIVSVLALTIYADDAQFDWKKILRNLVRNPMIQGLGTGIIVLAIREFIPLNPDGTLVFSLSGSLPWLYTVLQYLGRLATPLALIALGGQFSFSAVSGIRKELSTGVLMRLVLAPVLGFTMAFSAARIGWISLDPATISVLIAAYGSPIAVSSAVMAAEMHADDVLAGQIVVWSSLFSAATVFLMAAGFRFVGLL
ncbi:MAG: AEC family transporter [Butyricicoccaceae bacterium]